MRVYNEKSFSWDITRRMVERISDLKIIRYIMERKTFIPRFDPRSSRGFISRFVGVEKTLYALHDELLEMEKTICAINKANIKAVDLLRSSPIGVIMIPVNLSSDVQTPSLVRCFSTGYYKKPPKKFTLQVNFSPFIATAGSGDF
jgi:hypothetical protein